MSRTQKNKATEYHLGLLKAKLSQLRKQLLAPPPGSGGKGEGFDVMKSGNASVALIGFPSVGKSSFLNLVCGGTKSAESAHEFTTLTCIPGLLTYNTAKIQLLDLPGIIEGASKGKGRGKQVIAVARSCDMVFMMVDAIKGEIQKKLLTKELFDCGIRLNCKPRDIYIKKTKGGGMKINATVPLTQINKRLIEGILQSYKIHNCDVVIREDVSMDELIDAIEGNRKYLPCLFGYNKIDNLTIEELDAIAALNENVVLSVKKKLFTDFTIEKIWETLDMIRIYTKPKGSAPDLTEPVILKSGSSVEDLCKSIHRDMVKKFRYCLVWGRSAKHRPQTVGISHVLFDEDVCQVVTKEITN
eukprot:162191_1